MRKSLIGIAVLALVTGAGFADVIHTGEGGTNNGVLRNQEAYVQHITVPTGWTLNKVQWHMFYQNVSQKKWMYAQVYDSTGAFLTQGSALPWGNWFFVEATNLNLGAGDYYIQAFSNDAIGTANLGSLYFTGTTYSDGYAATGWGGGGALLNGTADFNLYLDYTVPEPATMGLLAVGGVLAVIRRRKR